MTLPRNSLQFKVVLPIFLLFYGATVLLTLGLMSTSHNLAKKNHAMLLDRHAAEIKRVLDTSFTELVAAQLTNNPPVEEAKKLVALEEIADILETEELKGQILRQDGSMVFSTLTGPGRERIASHHGRTGAFHFEIGLDHYNVYAFAFPAWGWTVVIAGKPIFWISETLRGEFGLHIPVVVGLWISLFGGIILIFRKNFRQPLKRILADLREGRPIAATGLDELDRIGNTINTSFQELRTRATELNRFKQVIDSAFDLVMMIGADGRISYLNPACLRMTGYSVGELLGESSRRLMQTGDEGPSLRAILETAMDAGVWRGEFTNTDRNGETVHASALVFTLPGPGPEDPVFACIQRDVTQERKLYEQLLRSQKLEALGTLAGGFAHDFNNILTSILGYADLLSSGVKDPEMAKRSFRTISDAARQGAELTQKILAITRKEKMHAGPVRLNGIVRSALSLLERSIPKSIEVVERLDEELPNVHGDPSQLQQVIVNLVINARDAMPEGGRLVVGTECSDGGELPARKDQDARDGYIKLTISDTGTGMDSETRLKVFDPFFTTKDANKGTGLGLFIVHSIVENHGGSINIYSEPGSGTRFSIYLPATGETLPPEVEEEDALEGRGTVLVIDDEPQILELCADTLESFGYNVLLAGSGARGVELYRENRERISLVLLDFVMPKTSGAEVYRTLKGIDPEVKVLLCSGYTPEGFSGIDDLISEGIAGFVSKPFSRNAIGRAIKKAI